MKLSSGRKVSGRGSSLSKGLAGEREKKQAGSRPGRGCKEELSPGVDTTEGFMESRVGVISRSPPGEEVGEVQPEPGKDHRSAFSPQLPLAGPCLVFSRTSQHPWLRVEHLVGDF